MVHECENVLEKNGVTMCNAFLIHYGGPHKVF